MTGQGQNAPAGWYPMDGGLQRYWDGAQWTEHVIAAPATDQQPGQAPQPGQVYGQAPQPGPMYGQAPGPAAGVPPAGQAPFAQAQPGLQGGGWQNSGASPYQGQVPQPFVDGYPMHTTPADRSSATVAHLLGLFFGFLGPLIMWLTKKDQSPYVAEQSREALNFQLSMILYWFGTIITLFFLIGIVLIPVLIILHFLLPIMAAVAANRGERYRYPLTIRMVT